MPALGVGVEGLTPFFLRWGIGGRFGKLVLWDLLEARCIVFRVCLHGCLLNK